MGTAARASEWRTWKLAGAATIALVAIAEPASAQVTAKVTVDNAYGFGWGDANGINNYQSGVINTTAGAIYNCPGGPETYSIPSEPSSNGYFYVVAWSDDSVFQGAVGTFSYPSGVIYTGVGAWEVFATGRDHDSTFPPLNGTAGSDAINAQIAIANANAGNPSTTSVGWVGTAGGLTYGPLAATGGTPFSSMPCMGPNARWMWFNASPGTITNPFNANPPGGGGHKEYLIFRLRTDPSGCIPDFNAPNPLTLCTGESITMSVAATSSTPMTFEWKDPNGIVRSTLAAWTFGPATPADAGLWSLTVSNACGSDTETYSVTVPTGTTAPTSIAASSTNVCLGQPITLTAVGGSGTNMEWFFEDCDGTPLTGSGTSITFTPTAAVGYNVCARWVSPSCAPSHCACIVVQATAPPTAPTSIGASSTSICSGTSVTLTASGGSGTNRQWFAGACGSAVLGTSATLIVSPTSTTTYYCRWERSPCAPSVCASVTITVSSPPTAPTSASASPGSICLGSSTTLTAAGGSGASLDWHVGSCVGPIVGSGAVLAVTPSATTTYYASWGAAPCPASGCASVTVEVRPVPSNDECSTATPITCIGPFSFSTSCATTSAVGSAGCDLQNDVWYRYQSTHTGRLTASACGSADYPVALAVFAGDDCFATCSPEKSLLKCADGESFCGTARLEVCVVAGLQYLIRVGGVGGATGSGTLFLTCDAATQHCESPANPLHVRTYSIVGPPTDTPWSFELTWPRGNVDPLHGPFVPGVPTSGTEFDVALRFATSINAGALASGCGTSVSAKAWPASGTLPVTLTVNTHPSEPNLAARLWVGPANSTPCCLVRKELPACGFNPVIQELDLPGFDCNGNERDDAIDIAEGFSLDADSNSIPDECEANVGTVFCAGDGVPPHQPCPCANDSSQLAGAGCLNSLGVGARLRASGGASLSADTLVLQGNAMPNSSALYFQGTAQAGGGAGIGFGDGLRCASGSVLRLGTKLNVSGASSYPTAGDATVSVRGAVVIPASVRTYQVWYRNAASYCTSSTFNLSNGLEVVWQL